MATVRYTVIDGELIAEKRGGVRSLYVPDALGSTVALLNSSQTKTDTFNYWPYGEVKTRTGTTATPFQYVGTQGCYQDTSTQIQMRARIQKPNYGRFLTQDPIGFDGDDWNPYRYVRNNPVKFTDPSGLKCQELEKDCDYKKRDCKKIKNSYERCFCEIRESLTYWEKCVLPKFEKWCSDKKDDAAKFECSDCIDAVHKCWQLQTGVEILIRCANSRPVFPPGYSINRQPFCQKAISCVFRGVYPPRR